MSFKKFMLVTLAVATIAAPAMARNSFGLMINLAPPQERVEYIPEPPQPDVVWAPGYWAWSHGRYYWVAGQYVQARPGFFWVADDWMPYGHSWRHVQGHWERQRFYDHNQDWRGHDDHDDHRFGDHDDRGHGDHRR